jgi:hypothetical protein
VPLSFAPAVPQLTLASLFHRHKDSLLTLIACVNPAVHVYSDTEAALVYAHRIKRVSLLYSPFLELSSDRLSQFKSKLRERSAADNDSIADEDELALMRRVRPAAL